MPVRYVRIQEDGSELEVDPATGQPPLPPPVPERDWNGLIGLFLIGLGGVATAVFLLVYRRIWTKPSPAAS
jgi:hypothetical protein